MRGWICMRVDSGRTADFDIASRAGKRVGVLRVRELSVRIQTDEHSFAVLDRISFDLERSGSLALMGESGSGKTTAALSLLRLLPPGAAASGRVELSGRDLLQVPEGELAGVRGAGIAMVFQDALAALNPVMRIGAQISEALRAHRPLSAADARTEMERLLSDLGLEAETARLYPHQLSGGMRKRALIATALACGPSLLVADEPTASLDTVAQAGIVEVFRRIREERGVALLVATHDPSVAARLCDRIAVLYAGRIVERAGAADLLERPRHPYTAGLWRSLPPAPGSAASARLEPVPGSPPRPWALPSGCRFRERCPRADAQCAGREPELLDLGGGREVACFHPLEAA
ncbi:MAG TPA: ABC transporter ATP-binding protein [Myxococcales bacterium]|nr:ABC transporter ATP-binding protein [Myxococcales bacterium]